MRKRERKSELWSSVCVKKRWCIKVIESESERDSDEREKMAEEVEKRKEEKGVPAAFSSKG